MNNHAIIKSRMAVAKPLLAMGVVSAISGVGLALVVAFTLAMPSVAMGGVVVYGGGSSMDDDHGMAYINSRAKARRNNVPYYKEIISTKPMGYISRRESVMIMREEGEFYYVEIKDKADVYIRKADLYQVVNLYQERITPQGYNKKAYYEILSIIERFDSTFSKSYFNAMPTAPHIKLQSVRANRSTVRYTILYSGINSKKEMHPSIATNPFREDMLSLIEVVMLKLAQQEDTKNITLEIVVPKFDESKRAVGTSPYYTINLPKELLQDNAVAIHILKDIGEIWSYAQYSGDYFQMFQTYPN